MNNEITLKKRLLSLLLTALMVFSMLPLPVFAADDYVAEVVVGSTIERYSDLAQAFYTAQYRSGATVKVLKDLESVQGSKNAAYFGIELPQGDVTLDLNGFTIQKYANSGGAGNSRNAFFHVTGSAKLTVKDSVGGGKIIQTINDPALIVDANASLTVLSGTIESSVAGYGIRVDSGILTVEGGAIKSEHAAGICVGGGTVTVTGSPEIYGGKSNALLITGESSVTLSGGTYTTNESNKQSIRTTVGNVGDLLADGFRYADADGNDVVITEDGHATESAYVAVSDYSIKYIDADGAVQKCTNFTELTDASAGLLNGWYAVRGTVNIKDVIGVIGGGTLNLILCEGAQLNLSRILYLIDGATLNIYGQSGGTGTLNVKETSGQPAIGMFASSPNGKVYVNIYGGTVTAQALYGAQPIGINPLATKATVTVTIAKGLKCVKTDDLNTAYPYNNTDDTSITITKCTEHIWTYENITGDTHDQTCDLCGTMETGVAHTTASYKCIRTDIHRLICACGKDYSTEYHTYTYAPNSDGLTHTATCKCAYAVDDIAHTYKGEDEICICGAVHAATYNGKNYASLQSAIDAAAPVGGTVTLAQQLNENVVVADGTVTIDLGGNRWSGNIDEGEHFVPLTVNGGSVTLKNGSLFQWWSSSSARTGIVINGGSVTVGEDVRVMGGVPGRGVRCPSITLNDGSLILKEGAALLSGLQVPDGKVPADYLPEGTAFVKCSYDHSSNSLTVSDPQEFVPDVYTASKLTEEMVIVSHTHDFSSGTACPCGFNCDHSAVDEATGKCVICNAQIYTAMVTFADDSCAHFGSFADAWDAAVAFEGSTLKLLCDLDLGSGDGSSVLNVYNGKFTLDLDRHTLEGTAQNTVIRVGGTADIKIINGKIENKFDGNGSSLSATDACAVRVESGEAAVTLDGVECIAGSNENVRGAAVYMIDGKLTATDSAFGGLVMLLKRTNDVSVRLASSDFLYGIAYGYVGTEREYTTVRAFFADGNMLFDANGKYIDTADDSLWESDDIGAYKAFTFSFGGSCSVKSHTHTYVDGKCAACDYVCPHDSGINDREAGYFEKAICSVCHAEYGDYAQDTTAPTGEIIIQGRSWWQTVLNKISFGLFFKENASMILTADDDSYSQPGFNEKKHAVKIEYLVSDILLDEEAVKASSGFREYTIPMGFSTERQYVVYVRLTDHAGNVAYAGSEGFEIDKTAPEIKNMVDGGHYSFCQETTIKINEKNIKTITLDGREQSHSNGEIHLRAYRDEEQTLIVTDEAGNTTTVYIAGYTKHDFDEETLTCRRCGIDAVAKLTADDFTGYYATVNAAISDGLMYQRKNIVVTLLRSVKYGDPNAAYINLWASPTSLTLDLNGYSLGGGDFTISNGNTGTTTIISSKPGGALKMSVTLRSSDATLIVGEGMSETSLSTGFYQYSGTLKIYGGSYYWLHVYSDEKKTELYGGKFEEIKTTAEGVTCADLLAPEYRYAGVSFADAKAAATHGNVEVIPCTHAGLDENGCCTGCGFYLALAVEKDGISKNFETFESAIRYAEEHDGCTVKLLQDIKLDEAMAGSLIIDGYKVELTTGNYTIDLNGKALDVSISQFVVSDNADLTIGDSVGGGKVISSTGAIIRTGNSVNNNTKLTVTGGDFNIVLRSYDRSALVLKGGSFKYVVSDRVTRCSPFVYLSDGYTFALTNPTGGNNYANEGNVEADHDGSKMVKNVSVVPVPQTIDEQPTDLRFYLTSQKADKYVKLVISTIEEWRDKRFRITFEKEDGTVINETTVTAFEKQEIMLSAVNFTASDSGSYRIKLELSGYVLYSNTFNITVTECTHPGYDADTHKCTQCGCALAAAIVNGSTITGYATFAQALAAAQTDANKDCTLELFGDTNEDFTAEKGIFTLNAKGHNVNGNITVNGATLSTEYGYFNGSITVESGELRIGGGYYTNTMSVKAGGKLFLFSGDCSSTVTAEAGGRLTVRNGGVKDMVAKSGSTLTVSNGDHAALTIEENVNAALSGGYFGKITVVGKTLIDCLDESRAFADNKDGEVIDGRTNEVTNIHIIGHTHASAWNTQTHEKLCDCGFVEATDTEAPVISSIKDGGVYYNLVSFSVTDANDFTVTVDGTPVQMPIVGYLLLGDNLTHTITATDVAGNSTTVTVTVYKLYSVTLPYGMTGYTVKGVSAVGHGMDYTFTVEIAAGYSKTEQFAVTVNGTPIYSDSDTYTIPAVADNIVVTVSGVADITPPDAEITVGTNKFNAFLNKVTFGLFFKKTQEVTVSVADAGSGLEKVEYLLSETAFSDEKAIVGDWTALAVEDGKASFSIEPNKKAYIFVRVTDKSDNVRVINSDGVVVYTDAEAITEAVDFTMLDGADVSFAVALNGNAVSALYNGDTLIGSDSYTVAADGTITLKNSYLRTLAAGEYTIRTAYAPMGETYKTGDAPAVTAVKLTVEKAAASIDFSADDFQKVYDGQPIATPAYTTVSDGAHTVEYKPFGADDTAYSTDVPKNAGKYVLRISVAETATYKAALVTRDYEILKRAVTIVGAAVEDAKTYDGTPAATITNAGTPSVNYDGKDLKVKKGKAAYNDKNVGTDKGVTFAEFALTGDAAANYTLTAQPAGVTADITAKAIRIVGATVENTKVYDGTTAATITNAGTLSENFDGDNLVLVRGNAAYEDKHVGSGKAVSFTDFALTGDAAKNYTLIAQPAVVTADITAKEITIVGATVANTRVYDGTTAATITNAGTPSENFDGNDLTVKRGKAAYSDKHVGIGKTVTFTEFALTGDAAKNYTLTAQPAAVTADITAKAITIVGTAVENSKVYDGTTDATITAVGATDGVVSGDKVTIAKGKAAYSDKHVGVDKTVTFTEFALTGNDAANYTLAAQPAGVTARISAKELTIDGLRVKNKPYDGKNTAEIDGTPALVGVVDGDVLTLVNGTPTFTSVTVGKNIPIAFTAFSLSGDSVTVGDYTLKQPSGITATITAYAATGDEYGVTSRDWIHTDFVITAKAGFALSLTDTADGVWTETLTASNETDDGKLIFFVKNTATGAISAAVTENYKIDKTAPTGEVSLNSRTAFQKFLNKITFGLFFKDDVTVKLTATDDASGVKSVQYFKSDSVLTADEVEAITDWVEKSEVNMTAEDGQRFIVYVRIEDNAGNIGYIGSDGATFDKTAPAVGGVENGRTYYVTQRVTVSDENFASVTLNEQPVDTVFTLVGDTDATYVIRAVDKAGNETVYTVTMRPIASVTDAIAAVTDGNVKSSDTDAILSVEQQIRAILGTLDTAAPTDAERTKLEEALSGCQALHDRIAHIAKEAARLSDGVNGYDPEKVTSTDKTAIEKLIADTDALLGGDNLTAAERKELEALRAAAHALLRRIAAVGAVTEKEEITATEDIAADNVKREDKETLEKAEKTLENALRDLGSNCTEKERKDMEAKLATVKAALAAVDNAEMAASAIEKLPSADDASLDDKSEIDRVKALIDGLTANEKAMLGDDALGKVDALDEKMRTLAAGTDKRDSDKTPDKSGDAQKAILPIALCVVIGGGAAAGVAVFVKKRKRSAK